MSKIVFSSKRKAYCYFRLPEGSVREFRKIILSKIDKAIKAAEAKGLSENERVFPFEVLYALGSADILIVFELSSFRIVPILQDCLYEVGDLGSAWVFTAPYEREESRAVVGSGQDEQTAFAHYLVHLRVNRSLYRALGIVAETSVVKELWRLIDVTPKLVGTVEAAMSWSDIVVTGTFSCSSEDFFRFVARISEVQALCANTGSLTPVFERTYTVVALPFNSEGNPLVPQATDLRFFSRLRSRPTRTEEALELLQRDTNESMIFSAIGHYDFVLCPSLSPETGATTRLVEYGHGSNSGGMDGDGPIDRTESYLVLRDPNAVISTLWDEENPGFILVSKISASASAGSDKIVLRVTALQNMLAALAGKIPHRLQQTVLSMLKLVSRIHRDRSNNSDAFPGISSVLASLEAILARVAEIVSQINREENDHSAKAHWIRSLATQEIYLKEWSFFCQQVLAERVTGAFNGIFSDFDRLTSLWGNLQKTLFIADHLMQEFYICAGSGLGFTIDTEKPCFATIYEPVNSVESYPMFGVVMLSTKYRLALSRGLTSLWHEAAMLLFFRQFPVPDRLDTVIEERLWRRKVGLQKMWEDLHDYYEINQLNPAPVVDSAESRISSSVIAKKVALLDVEKDETFLYRLIADIYADVVVFFFGHHGSMISFCRDLTTETVASICDVDMPDEEVERRLEDLLLRLYCVSVFEIIRSSESPSSLEQEPAIDEAGVLSDSLEGYRVDLLGFIGGTKQRYADPPLSEDVVWCSIEKLMELAISEVLEKPRFSHRFSIPKRRDLLRVVANVWKNIHSQTWAHLIFPFLYDLSSKVSISGPGDSSSKSNSSNIDRLRQGEVVRLKRADVNSCFFYLYKEDLARFLSSPEDNVPVTDSRFRAALSKSAIISYLEYSGVSGC